jgi:hypothetical protein
MSVTAADIMRVLDLGGIEVRLDGDRLVGRAVVGGPLPAGAVGYIKRFRAEIIDALAERERLAEIVRNVMALNDAEYQQWRHEVLAGNDDPGPDRHDREALRQVAAIKKANQALEEEMAA